VFAPDGLTARQLAAFADAKEAGQPLASQPGATAASAPEAVAWIARHALARPVLIDLTADETLPALRRALTEGMDIVLANKRPLSAPLADVEALRLLATRRNKRILHETTVGAGLPVMDSYAKLVETGDTVLRIEGCTSGTLGFLLTEIGKGRAFSASLREAMSRGFTEPDPRDDLSGMDVARKALILARMMGFTGEAGGRGGRVAGSARCTRCPARRFWRVSSSRMRRGACGRRRRLDRGACCATCSRRRRGR
jgi:aspartokinase/homoserine dehydrogenase 1